MSHTEEANGHIHKYSKGGTTVTIGTVLAVIISWELHQSVILAVLHGLLGWLYILYCAIEGII